MASPLLEYANALLRAEAQGSVSIVNGRPTIAAGSVYVVRCYMTRQQYSGVTSGSKRLPLESQLEGRMLPGASGDQFYYRGYALEKLTLPDGVDWLDDLSSYNFSNITSQESFLLPAKEVEFKFGNDPVMKATVQRSSGKYGGDGIDSILYSALGGVEIQLTGSEVQN
jgi:hypothetical protein